MKLKVGKGFDDVLFGLTEEEVIQRLGQPDKRYASEQGDISLQYFSLRSELVIEADHDHRFGWVRVSNPNAELFGRRLLGQSCSDVLEFVSKHLDGNIDIEDFGSFESHTFDEHWIEFQFEFDVLTGINFGFLFDGNEKPIWPTI